jgi:hypothetical protein
VYCRLKMGTATPGITSLVFGAALAGSFMVRAPGRVIWPPVMTLCEVTTRVFRLNTHDDEAAAARKEPCPGSVTARAGIRDEALTPPAASVMIPVLSRPAEFTLGRTTGEPPV